MDNHVLVIGAGPVGLCLALALAERGLHVEVVERRAAETLASPEFDGREIALNHASIRLLQDLHIWTRLPSDATVPLRRARVMDQADPGFEVDGAAFTRDRLGTLVSNHLIRKAAWEAVSDEPRIRVHAGVNVDALETGTTSARVMLSDGRSLEAPLLAAADSRFSEARRAMGISARMHDFGLSMLLCRVRHSEPNQGTAWEWFGRGQTRAKLPLGEHLSSIVLTIPGTEALRLEALAPHAFAREIATRYEGRLGDVELVSTRHAYPLVACWARRFVTQRFALVGDAAIGMHPVTAHGFNTGLMGIEYLAHAVEDGWRTYGDPGHPVPLARYQRRLRISAATLFAGTQTVARLFTSEGPGAQPLRRAALHATRELPVLRRALVASVLDDAARPANLAHHLGLGLRILAPRPGGRHKRLWNFFGKPVDPSPSPESGPALENPE